MVSRPALASSAFVYTSDVAIVESCEAAELWSRSLGRLLGRSLPRSDGTCA